MEMDRLASSLEFLEAIPEADFTNKLIIIQNLVNFSKNVNNEREI